MCIDALDAAQSELILELYNGDLLRIVSVPFKTIT